MKQRIEKLIDSQIDKNNLDAFKTYGSQLHSFPVTPHYLAELPTQDTYEPIEGNELEFRFTLHSFADNVATYQIEVIREAHIYS